MWWNVRSSGECDEMSHMPSDRCEDKRNEPAWILFIAGKSQVKCNTSDTQFPNVMEIIWNVNVYYWQQWTFCLNVIVHYVWGPSQILV